jgi:hypothetical protein
LFFFTLFFFYLSLDNRRLVDQESSGIVKRCHPVIVLRVHDDPRLLEQNLHHREVVLLDSPEVTASAIAVREKKKNTGNWVELSVNDSLVSEIVQKTLKENEFIEKGKARTWVFTGMT